MEIFKAPQLPTDEPFTSLQQWTTLLKRVLNDKVLSLQFHEYLISINLVEQLLFWLDVSIFATSTKIPQSAMRVYIALVYLIPDAPLSISVSFESKKALLARIDSATLDEPFMFDHAFHHVQWILRVCLYNFLQGINFTGWRLRPSKMIVIDEVVRVVHNDFNSGTE